MNTHRSQPRWQHSSGSGSSGGSGIRSLRAAALPRRAAIAARASPRLVTGGKVDEMVRRLAAPHALFWRQPRLPAFVCDAIGETALRETGYFDAAAVAQLLAAHRARRADHSRLLTGVLTTQLFNDLFL